MKPLPILRSMAVEKARRERHRYTWSFNKEGRGHFEILDAGYPAGPLCDVIATTPNADLRDSFIMWMEAEEYQPARWIAQSPHDPAPARMER